jgi:hypothetical protein
MNILWGSAPWNMPSDRNKTDPILAYITETIMSFIIIMCLNSFAEVVDLVT